MANNYTQNKTYGFIVLPYVPEENKPKPNLKEKLKFNGQVRSALRDAMLKHPSLSAGIIDETRQEMLAQNARSITNSDIDTITTYMKDNRIDVVDTVTSKFSGIAVSQMLVDGKVTCQSAADYLFMGFAPALGISASAMGYSGLNQMKDALTGGSIDVGGLFNGFTRTLKGATDLKDQIRNRNAKTGGEVVEFDLTKTHTENYTSETPDRRTDSGSTLSETVHNLPVSISLDCALQDKKRYSVRDFKSIMQELRRRKEGVSVYLGEDDRYKNYILVSFIPHTDCTKSGYDFSLELKENIRGEILYTEVKLAEMPPEYIASDSVTVGEGISSSIGNVDLSSNLSLPDVNADIDEVLSKNFGALNWKKSALLRLTGG